MAKKKYYVVWEGVNPGIYETWAECLEQTKGYPNAKYKSFKNKEDAQNAYHSAFTDHIGIDKKPVMETLSDDLRKEIVTDSISVDAACSGNPGIMEYQGVDTMTKFQFFYKKFPLGTNNIGEFLALVHGLAYLQKQGKDTAIYTDSKIAMGWIKAKKCRSKLEKNQKTKALWDVVARAEMWLHNNHFMNPILKWETKKWGEIPADFGRK